MSLEELVINLTSGLSKSALYFLLAAGLTLTLGAMSIVNFAHGTFYMFGAYVATLLIADLGSDRGFLVALLAAPLAVAAGAAAIDRVVIARVHDRGHMAQMLATFALVLIGDDIVRQVFGNRPRTAGRPSLLEGSVELAGARIAVFSLATIGIAVAIAALLFWLLRCTRVGLLLAASVDDAPMLDAMGIDTAALRTAVFAGGAGLAGLAGMLIAPMTAVRPGIDVELLIVAFAVVIIGGLGSIEGAIVGSLIVGLVESFGVFFIDRGTVVVVFALMVLVLVVRPTGLVRRAVA